MPCDFLYESIARASGHRVIAGVDEAGRGPLAGPVVAAAVVLPEDGLARLAGLGELDDSKKLTPARREALYAGLVSPACADVGLRWASAVATVEEIESLNILRATHLAMRRAVEALEARPSLALIDGLAVRDFPVSQRAVVKGDGKCLSIAAASIIAKVTRDRMMRAHAREYPAYGFDAHMGYGTRRHLEALRVHGICPIHRKTFAPVAQLTLSLDG